MLAMQKQALQARPSMARRAAPSVVVRATAQPAKRAVAKAAADGQSTTAPRTALLGTAALVAPFLLVSCFNARQGGSGVDLANEAKRAFGGATNRCPRVERSGARRAPDADAADAERARVLASPQALSHQLLLQSTTVSLS